jgi:hypothetical protein
MPKTLQEEQKEWYDINAPLGRALGFPECCIKAFCNDTPQEMKRRAEKGIEPGIIHRMRYVAGCVNGKFTGFIPCPAHALDIVMGAITLESLITNRDKSFPPFPVYGNHEK